MTLLRIFQHILGLLRRGPCLIFTGMLFLFLCPVASWAQTATAEITGSIQDSSGASVPQAKITAKNVATGVETSATSGTDGYYTIPFLQPGQYHILVSKGGFQSVVRTGVTLIIDQKAKFDFVLQIGAVTQTVEITAQAPLVQSEDSTVGTLVDNKRINDLPLNGRDVFSLANLAVGVNNTGTSAASIPHIAGSQAESGEVQIDGATDIAPSVLAGENAIAYEPQVDAVQEFSVQVNGLAAEYGRFAGGVINVVTKSGTNSFHGDAYVFARNDVLDANDFFYNTYGLPKTGFHQYQYGGTFGGPILIPKVYNGKNKTFFFIGYEKTDIASAGLEEYTVPTAAERNGNFSNLKDANGIPIILYDPATGQVNPANSAQWIRSPFPSNTIPTTRFNPTGLKVMSYYPLPNTMPTNAYTNTNNYILSGSSPEDVYKIDSRLDQYWSDKWRSFLRVSRYVDTAYPLNYWHSPATPGYGFFNNEAWSATLDNTFSFTPTLIGDLRYTLDRSMPSHPGYAPGFNIATNLGMPQSLQTFAETQIPEFPYVTMGGVDSNLGQYFSDEYSANTSHNIIGNLTKIWGTHTIKTGGEYRKQFAAYLAPCCSTGWYPFSAQYTQQEATTPNPWQGYPVADLLLGYDDDALDSVVPVPLVEGGYYGMYIQDDWKIKHNLTLNLGVRYEFTRPHTEHHNNLSYWDPSVPSPIASEVQATPNCPACGHLMGAMEFTNATHRTQAPIDWSNIGPRLGFSYSPASKWVVRGGYAITYPPSEWDAGDASVGEEGYNVYSYWQPSWDGGRTFNTTLSNPFPYGITPAPGSSAGGSTDLGNGIGDSFFGIPSVKGPTEYIQQWNFNVQRSLPGNALLEVGYIGMHGLNLINGSSESGADNFDQTSPQYLSLGSQLTQYVPNPLYGLLPAGSTEDQPTVPLTQLLKPYPQYSGISLYRRPEGSLEYDAMTVRLEKRYSHGVSFLASYTAGKEIDNGPTVIAWWTGNGAVDPGGVSNHYNLNQDRSVSPFDVSQRLVLSYLFELPFGRGKALAGNLPNSLNALVSGWQFNGISTFETGTPVVILGITGTTGLGNVVNRPDITGDPKVANPTLNHWFNTSAFSPAPNYTYGTAPRTLSNVRNPGVCEQDLSLFKNTYFGAEKRFNVQFRLEAFNAFNTAQFGVPGDYEGGGNFGVITSDALPPRQVQLALKFIF